MIYSLLLIIILVLLGVPLGYMLGIVSVVGLWDMGGWDEDTTRPGVSEARDSLAKLAVLAASRSELVRLVKERAPSLLAKPPLPTPTETAPPAPLPTPKETAPPRPGKTRSRRRYSRASIDRQTGSQSNPRPGRFRDR